MEANKKLGILGLGNMGNAILEGLVEENWDSSEIYVFDEDDSTMETALDRSNVNPVESSHQLATKTDVLLVAVKPKDVEAALGDCNQDSLKVISIAAGLPIEKIRKFITKEPQIIRVMPNIPAQIQEGMSFLSPGENVSDDFLKFAQAIFESVGKVSVVNESQMDAVTALSGSGPAYVFYLMEAMYEAGIYMGLDEEQALLAAKQTVRGAAGLASSSEKSPDELRRNVSSPGGTTVEAIKSFDESGLKGKIIGAIDKAWKKSQSL